MADNQKGSNVNDSGMDDTGQGNGAGYTEDSEMLDD
jgi:hypothetical protein